MARTGRPYRGEPVLIRISTEALAAVDAYAAEQGISRAEAIRRIVSHWIATKDQP